jgi:iron complex outermembrane receptor protein
MFDLPGGRVEVAAGVLGRQEYLRIDPDPLLAEQNTIGGVNFGPTDGERRVWEMYGEVYLPLMSDRRWAERLDLHLAGRVSHYSDFGSQSNPRISLRYQPVRSVTIRGSYAHGFRAATLNQLFRSRFQSFEQLNDPCSSLSNVGVLPGCVQQSDPTLTQFLTTKGGDEDLQAERSKTASVGFVWQPEIGVNELTFSVDAFRIRQKDVVDSNTQYIVNSNADNLSFPNRVLRDENGNISEVLATLLNIGERDVSGIDVGVTYMLPETRSGVWTIGLNASHIASFKDKFDPDTPSVEQAGTFSDEASGGNGALPDWKANLSVNWRHENWQAQYNLYHVSAVEELVPISETWRTMESWQTHNVQMTYLGPMTAWFRVALGVNNLLDEEPPFSAAAFNDSYDSRTYDIVGRYYYLQLEKTL